jgi:hypothetical protein
MRVQRHGVAGSDVGIEYAHPIILIEQRVVAWRSA